MNFVLYILSIKKIKRKIKIKYYRFRLDQTFDFPSKWITKLLAELEN